MVRRLLLLVLLVALLAAGIGAVVVTGRAPLRDARQPVDARWATLRPPLAARYSALAQLPPALTAAGVGDRAAAVELRGTLDQWRTLAARGDDPGGEAGTANALEGLTARIRADVAASPRLSSDAGITAALAGVDRALVPADAVAAFDSAVRRYQRVRTSWSKRPAALAFDFGPVPVLILGRSA